jgi:hypothetical protein
VDAVTRSAATANLASSEAAARPSSKDVARHAFKRGEVLRLCRRRVYTPFNLRSGEHEDDIQV